MRTCIAESKKRSAKGSNFREDDRVLPLYGSETAGAAICHTFAQLNIVQNVKFAHKNKISLL